MSPEEQQEQLQRAFERVEKEILHFGALVRDMDTSVRSSKVRSQTMLTMVSGYLRNLSVLLAATSKIKRVLFEHQDAIKEERRKAQRSKRLSNFRPSSSTSRFSLTRLESKDDA